MTGLTETALEGGDADTDIARSWLDDGRTPNGARGRKFADKSVHGVDLTFSAPKSVSLIRALTDDVAEKVLATAHTRAVRAAMDYLHRQAGYTRVHNPLTGNKDLQRLPGLVAIAYQHETSRCGDPHLHTHVIVPNRQARADGALVSLDSKSLYHEAKAAGIIYQATLRHLLHAERGFEFHPVDPHTGMAEIAGNKPVVRYQLTVDTGIVNGKRKQLRRRFQTEKEARAELAKIQGQVAGGTYVQPSTLTVEQACTDWLRSRHKIRTTTAAGYEYVLQPVQSELGTLAVQDLTRRHIDELIVKLRAGELMRPGGKARKAWSARSCNYMLGALSLVLGQLVAEGRLTRNVAALVDRVPGKAKKLQTFTADQVRSVLRGIAGDRNRHAWHLALAGLRRGEIAGQRWADIDLENRTLRIGTTRVDVGGRAVDQDEPKTTNAGRVLPVPEALLTELTAAKSRQAPRSLF